MTSLERHSLLTQEIVSEAGNYNRWIYDQLRPYLGRRVVDIGCSIGNITGFFLDREMVVGVDVLPEAVERISERFRSNACFTAVAGDIDDESLAADVARRRPDTVVCVNVLEHVENDVRALRNMRNMLVPGGKVLLVVPALAILYGTMDSGDGHYRRYTRRSLGRALRDAGLWPLSMRYFNAVGMFGWFFNGRVLRREYVPRRQMKVYDRLVPFFRALERTVRPPVGQTLFAAAETATA